MPVLAEVPPSVKSLQFGQSGHWPPIVATTAMVRSAVAEVISTLSGFFLRWPDAGVDPVRSFNMRSSPQKSRSSSQ